MAAGVGGSSASFTTSALRSVSADYEQFQFLGNDLDSSVSCCAYTTHITMLPKNSSFAECIPLYPLPPLRRVHATMTIKAAALTSTAMILLTSLSSHSTSRSR